MFQNTFPDDELMAQQTARMLLEVKAVHFRADDPYKLTSGLFSPVYIDCRKLISSEETVCPHCGARQPGALSGPLRQLFRGDLELTDVIVWITAALYGVSVLVDVRAAFDVSQLTGIWGLLNLGSPSPR